MANIKQIAQQAGVSVATVSRVLNQHPYVSEEKRKAVLDAVEKLDYARNLNALPLLRGKTNRVGVMLPYINHAYFAALMEGIAQEALEHHYRLLVCQTNYETQQELEVLDMLKTKQIDGVIVCSKALPWEAFEPYSAHGPIIACSKAPLPLVSSVYIDHYGCFQYGMRYLLERGHRRIGFCLSRSGGESSRLRRQGYEDVLREAGEPVREEWLFYDCFDIEDGARVVRQMLAMEERPTALLIAGDQVAAGAIAEAEKFGLRVPEDLAVIGYDNQPIAKVLGITTIDIQLTAMGRTAFGLFRERAADASLQPENKELTYRLITRRTV